MKLVRYLNNIIIIGEYIMKKKIMIVSLILATVLVIISLGVSFGVSSSYRDLAHNYDGFFQYHDETIKAMLDLSKNKTVKNDLGKTVSYSQLFNTFGLLGNIALSGAGAEDKNNIPIYSATALFDADPNDFLKQNKNGDLYTVFKTDNGATIYCTLKVNRYENNGVKYESINFGTAYWVYDKILEKSAFDNIVEGKTTRREVYEITDDYKMFSESSHILETTLLTNPESREAWAGYYLTTEGTYELFYEYSEEIGEQVVTHIYYTEGCPINPEDLI